jgi:hypothetical protein
MERSTEFWKRSILSGERQLLRQMATFPGLPRPPGIPPSLPRTDHGINQPVRFPVPGHRSGFPCLASHQKGIRVSFDVINGKPRPVQTSIPDIDDTASFFRHTKAKASARAVFQIRRTG